MSSPGTVIDSDGAVLLVGGSPDLSDVLPGLAAQAARIVAADSGAEAVIALDRTPDAVIGDMDSLSDDVASRLPTTLLHHIAEQDSTDFEKCLSRIEAPLILGAGFTGGRVDHTLAAMNVLVRYPQKRCVLVGREDAICVAPPGIELALPKKTRLSLFPMAAVTGTSEGLNWPIDGLLFEPAAQIGTSNFVTGPVRLLVDQPAMLLILPRVCLPDFLVALGTAPRWSVA
ncbi:thiamine diphosphokinase [Qingshengfaniella alkalisoli]|uniref:Thiamine diphosphokinase n=1 Tax=Qingshengfaniella alkalisoli TaxID=2599296 RepID=A0A5B8J4W7_9RHOB|nr:thiamine diphosphokinase [Qingshengfaniella alkalisoli]QDY69587.1 thiamine diphosphokinase [Qingshengfaniella alkalisoli]